MVRDADRGRPPRASPLADQTRRLGRLGGRPVTSDPVCRRVVLDIRGRALQAGVGVGWCFGGVRHHARHKNAHGSERLGPGAGAEPAKHNDSSVRVAFRPVNPAPTGERRRMDGLRERRSREPAPVATKRRIRNRFPPPPLFLHEPGRFEGTRADISRLDGCRQTLAVERVRPQTTRRRSVTDTRSNGFDSLFYRLDRFRLCIQHCQDVNVRPCPVVGPPLSRM